MWGKNKIVNLFTVEVQDFLIPRMFRFDAAIKCIISTFLIARFQPEKERMPVLGLLAMNPEAVQAKKSGSTDYPAAGKLLGKFRLTRTKHLRCREHWLENLRTEKKFLQFTKVRKATFISFSQLILNKTNGKL